MRARRFHHRVARMCGYFWMPCPLCGQEFGAHEWKSRGGRSAMITTRYQPNGWVQSGRGICPDCTRAGRGDQRWVSSRAEV